MRVDNLVICPHLLHNILVMRFVLTIFLLLLFISCERNINTETDDFIRGVDLSWVTEQEADGVKFYDKDGIEKDCFDLLHSEGANLVRLRVWVDSENDYCEVEDVVAKAKRAQKAGMSVMLDFHYSDWFADPSRQDKPKSWANLSFGDLVNSVTNHTIDVLTILKNENISPKWVQMGNETRNGMLFNDGYLWKNNQDWKSYITLSNAGYDAVKCIFPEVEVIVHINNAWECESTLWWFEEFIKNGGKVDVLGLSHYPQTERSLTWEQMNAYCFQTVRSLNERFDKSVLLCEIGTKSNNINLATCIIKQLSDTLRTIDGCLGYCYWEPQVYGNWKPSIYKELGWNAYDMGAFTSDGRPSDIFKVW